MPWHFVLKEHDAVPMGAALFRAVLANGEIPARIAMSAKQLEVLLDIAIGQNLCPEMILIALLIATVGQRNRAGGGSGSALSYATAHPIVDFGVPA